MGLAIIVPNTSFGDTNLGKVTLSGSVPIKGLYINLEGSYTGAKVDLKCSYLPANTTQRDVVWSIESGGEYASISGSVLTILQGAVNNEVAIRCTSASNSSIYATKTIHVTYQASGDLVILEGRAIVTDGIAYINITKDFTGEKRFNLVASTFDIDVLYNTTSTNMRCLFGGFKKGTQAGGYGVFIRPNSYNSVIRVVNTDTNNSYIGQRIKIKNNLGTVTIGENDIVTETLTPASQPTCIGDLYLGCYNNNGNIEMFANDVQIYGLKFSTLASGEICDLVPCIYRGTVGMYNKTTQEVMLPETGTFTLI